MINNQQHKLIGEFKNIQVFRDVSGKWFVKCDGITTQHALNATEIVRYLCNVQNNS